MSTAKANGAGFILVPAAQQLTESASHFGRTRSAPGAKGIHGIVTAVVLAISLVGCGGGGGSASTSGSISTPTATLLGTFTDAPVVGATYVTSSGSGGCTTAAPCTTDKLGQFKYAAGDTVTFSAAGVTLGATGSLNPATDGTTVVTPVTLVSGATAATDPGPTAIAQFLQTLSSVAAGTSGNSGSGVLTMPTDAATVSKLGTTFTGAGISSTTSVSSVVSQLQAALNLAFGLNQYTVVPPGAAQAALTQGVNSNGIVGTVWSGPCVASGGVSKGGGTLYFQPGGTLSGFTADGKPISGSWAGSPTAGAGVTIQAFASGGGTATGTIAAGANTGTAIVNDKSGSQCTLTLTKVVSGVAAANTQYMGGWYVTYTPNNAGTAAGESGGTAYLVAAPDGTFSGVTDGGQYFNGSWSTADGTGSATLTATGSTLTVSIDLSTKTGSLANGSTSYGSLTLSRTGILQSVASGGTSTANQIPLLLNVADSWPNTATSASSFSLALNLYDASGKLVAGTAKSESTALSSNGVRTTTTDDIAVSYPQGSASTYQLTIGSTGNSCSITGGTKDANGNSIFTGSVNDLYSGNANAYPTVYVTCADLSTSSPAAALALLLNVNISWANTATSVSSFALALDVRDAQGNVVAGSVKSESIALNTSGVRSSTTDNIAASYPGGVATIYQPRISNSNCKFVGGTTDTNGDSIFNGAIVDASSGNANAYPTVQVTCN